jgi:hypothetical protein
VLHPLGSPSTTISQELFHNHFHIKIFIDIFINLFDNFNCLCKCILNSLKLYFSLFLLFIICLLQYIFCSIYKRQLTNFKICKKMLHKLLFFLINNKKKKYMGKGSDTVWHTRCFLKIYLSDMPL